MANPRKPTALKEQAGTLRPCRENPKEPKPDLGVPVAPDHLSERAARVYPLVAEMLFNMGVLCPADAFAVEGLCQSYADWRDAVEFLDEHGTTFITIKVAPDGTEFKDYKAFPQVSQRNDADKRMRSWLQSCGLTPADRQRISRLDPGAEDDFFADL